MPGGAIFFLSIILLIITAIAFYQLKKAMTLHKYKSIVWQILSYSLIIAIAICAFAMYYNVYTYDDYIEDIVEYFATSFIVSACIACAIVFYLNIENLKKTTTNLHLDKENLSQYKKTISNNIANIKQKFSQS